MTTGEVVIDFESNYWFAAKRWALEDATGIPILLLRVGNVRFWASATAAADLVRSGKAQFTSRRSRPSKSTVGPCLLWKHGTSGGYGKIKVDGATLRVHRVAWERAHGPIPNGYDVLHRCDNRRCYNPAHLFLGTNQDNVSDRGIKGRAVNPIAGLKGEKHHNSGLSDSQAREIRQRSQAGESTGALAEEFGVSAAAVSKIKHGKTYRHV